MQTCESQRKRSHKTAKFPCEILLSLGIIEAVHQYHTIDARVGMIQSLYVQKSTYTNQYGHHSVHIQMMVTSATTIPEPKLFVSHLTFIQLSKRLQHIQFDLNYVEVVLCE